MTIIQHKRGLSTNWAASDPILSVSEIGYEIDTGNFKIGDGVNVWSALPYFQAGSTVSSGTGSGTGSGTVTSVDLSVPIGLVVSNNPITEAGTLTVDYDTGYAIPTTAKQTEWDTAYSWGDHSAAGYLTSLGIGSSTQAWDADLDAIAALTADGVLRKTSGTWGMDTSTYLTSASNVPAGNLQGTIPSVVLGNSTLYVGTTAIALNRSSANLVLTGITSLVGGTGTTAMSILSADTSGIASGAVLIASGDATSSTAGTVKVDSGSNGTPGSGGANVSIGTTNASSVTIGRSTTTTTINGTLNATIPGIGSTIQAWDTDLDAVAALAGTGIAKRTGAGTWTTITDNSTNWDSAYTDRLKWDGGSSGLTASTGRTSLGATTVGSNLFTLANPSATTFLKINPDNSITAESASVHRASIGGTTVGENIFTLTNPSAITFLRINADNTVTARSATNFRSDIGAGTGNGTVTTVSVASANGFAGTVANASTTPAITLSTTITGLLSGNGTAISAASVGYGDTTNPYGSKTTNYVLAGPAGGPSAAPTFRALVSGDIPDLSGVYLPLGGTAASATTATSADTVKTISDATNASFFPVFVNSNNGTAASESLYTDAGLIYNPSSNNLSIGGDFAVNGGDITTSQTTFNLINDTATTLNIGGGATTALNIGSASGTTFFASTVDLRAGGTLANTAPLYFSSSTSVLTTPAPGAMEYDNLTTYVTPANGGRAVNMLGHYYILSAPQGPDDTETVASMLDGATLGITVAAGTTYQIEVVAPIQHQYIGSAAATTSFGFTATTVTGSPTASFTYQIRYGSNITGFTSASAENVAWRTTGSQLIGAAISSGSRYIQCHVTGILRVTGTGTVKVYPIITQSVTGNSAYAQAGSFFRLTPIGNGTVPSVGNWT